MSELKMVVKDYRVIKSAVVQFEPGITLISATNSSGKSTLIKALKTVMDGEFGLEANPRHGTSGYSVGLKCDGDKLTVRRVGRDTFIRHNDEPERSKLGKGSVDKLVPGFPLKRFETLDSVFYPNVVSQGRLPIFDDISVFELFSAMFGDVALLNSRQDFVKKDLVKTKKAASDAEALLKHCQTEELQYKTQLDALEAQHPDLDSQYEKTTKVVAMSNELTRLQNELYTQFPLGISDNDRDMADELTQAQPVIEAYNRLQAVQGYLNTLDGLQKQSSEITAKLEALPDVDFDLLEKYIQLQVALSEKDNTEASLSALDEQIKDLEQQLSEVKCSSILEGTCPYQAQITKLLQAN